jgi:hypothetical protein
MRTGQGWAFLGFGPELPPPSGPIDEDLKAAMIREAHSSWFWFRVSLWAVLTGRGWFDWQSYWAKLKQSEFRESATRLEWASFGWAGLGADGVWLFGVPAYARWGWGKSAMRHELFHAAQDYKTGMFTKRRTPRLVVMAELSAHLWGGPLIGVSLIYVPILFVVGVPVWAAVLWVALQGKLIKPT